MSGKRPVVRPQLDLFVPFLSDIDLRDQMELMEWPFFSLSKNNTGGVLERLLCICLGHVGCDSLSSLVCGTARWRQR